MKVQLYITALFLFFFCSSKSQTTASCDTNFICFQDSLKEYKIDTCLVYLLTEVVELDTNYLRFPPDKFYYELSFEDRKSYRNLTILPSRWNKSAVLDFKGVIKIGRMSFLCRGDIERDSLFTRAEAKTKVQLRKPKGYQYDSIDIVIEAYTWKPTLAGKYTFCNGVPIDLYILVGKSLEGYGVKENKK